MTSGDDDIYGWQPEARGVAPAQTRATLIVPALS
jgi:hypothetical protein